MSLVFPPLYAIIDAALLKTSELSFVEMMAESGVELLQYRNKSATSRQFFEASGSIFATTSKDNPDPVVGLDLLREARGHTRKPLVAIGGITLERAADAFSAGADSLAVARDLIAAENPAARAERYLREAARAREKERG